MHMHENVVMKPIILHVTGYIKKTMRKLIKYIPTNQTLRSQSFPTRVPGDMLPEEKGSVGRFGKQHILPCTRLKHTATRSLKHLFSEDDIYIYTISESCTFS